MTDVEEAVGSDNDAVAEIRRQEESKDNLKNRLREKRREIAENDEPLDKEIPGYGFLYARYRKVEWEEIDAIFKKAMKKNNPRKELLGAAAFLVKACEQLMIMDEGVLKPINAALPELGDEPVGFTKQVAELMNIEAETAVQVVLGLFANDLAVSAQYNEVSEWMRDRNKEDDTDF